MAVGEEIGDKRVGNEEAMAGFEGRTKNWDNNGGGVMQRVPSKSGASLTLNGNTGYGSWVLWNLRQPRLSCKFFESIPNPLRIIYFTVI